jgi:hypothetical protein
LRRKSDEVGECEEELPVGSGEGPPLVVLDVVESNEAVDV